MGSMNFKQHHTSEPRQEAMGMHSNVDIVLYVEKIQTVR